MDWVFIVTFVALWVDAAGGTASFHTVKYFRIGYEASISQQRKVRRCRSSSRRGDEVRIVFPPTFSNRRNALTARGASFSYRIPVVGTGRSLTCWNISPEEGFR